MTRAGLPELVAKAFEAACDADSMAEFLAGVAGFFGAQQGAILISPLHNPSDMLPITFSIEPERIREWFADGDKPGTGFNKFAPLRTGDTVLENNSHHQPDHQPNHRLTHMLGGVVTFDERNRCFMVLWREADQPPFSGPEEETLRALMCYFRRAIDVNTRFVKIYCEHQNAIMVLDQAPRAIIILGQNGQPTYQNLEATRVLSKNDGLTMDQSGITIDDEDANRKVSTFLEQIRGEKPAQFNAHQLATVATRKSGVAPFKLIMYALPYKPTQALLNSDQGLAILVIYDPESFNDLDTSLLHNFYKLTRAEASLAHSLFIGQSLPEASDQLGISINTTRTQLRSIFKKVGVHSQAALMQEFAKSVAPS